MKLSKFREITANLPEDTTIYIHDNPGYEPVVETYQIRGYPGYVELIISSNENFEKDE